MSIYEQLGGSKTFTPEAIKNYAGTMHPFAKELVQLCTELKAASMDGINIAANKSFCNNVKKIVKQHLNINLTMFSIANYDGINAWCYAPDINTKNPMFNHINRNFEGSDINGIIKDKKSVVGWCDSSKVRLEGDFAKVECEAGVSSGTIKKCTPDEIAATICHEIGHIWSAFEFMSLCVFRSVHLIAACQDIKKEWDTISKVNILDVLVKNDIVSDISTASINSKDDIDRYMCEQISIITKEASDLARSSHDNTMAESYADQFATRLGLGNPLSRVLSYGSLEDYEISEHKKLLLLSNILNVVREIFIVVFSFIYLPILLTLAAVAVISYMHFIVMRFDSTNIYDDYRDRMINIKLAMIAALKRSEDNSERSRLLNDISDVNHLLDTYVSMSRTSVFKETLKILVPYFRNNINKKQLQQSYERLINNELYVVGNKFKNLSA